uniref:Auxin-induced protein n=1 Tax=Cajanus cajan TaxID=3821 RepID=A0A151SHB1_CAJCA|nr:Auxin-responsive protein IAA27 [Cajanus cajan]
MSTQLEHDYIGLTEGPSMEKSCDKISSSVSSNLSSEDENTSSLNFKETELRLGLPGCGAGISLFGKDLQKKHSGYSASSKNLKRGFSDAISSSSSSGRWIFSASDDATDEADFGNASARCNKEVAMVPLPHSEKPPQVAAINDHATAPAAKAQVVGWPPIRSFRKNTMAYNVAKMNNEGEVGCLYVKVSMDGAPYLRKVDLKTYTNYIQLSSALEKMFSCFTIGQCGCGAVPGEEGLSESAFRDLVHGSEYVLTYEDKDGDWMLMGDVPWEMFTESCKKLRIMKGSEAIGLAPRAMEKCRSQN